MLLFLTVFGCVRQQKAVAQDEVRSYISGSLDLPSHPEAPKLIYIEATEQGKPLPVSGKVKAALAAENFRIVDNPSEAGYILNLSVLQSGEVNPENFQKLVDEGYGKPAQFQGAGGEGLLVDALLVQRRIPAHSKAGKVRLKNISSRNALESAQMRMGVLIPRQVVDHKAAREALAINIARILRSELANEAMAQAIPK